MVRCPRLFRPPYFLRGSSKDFSGLDRVTSSNPDTDRKRVPAVIGRNCRMLISTLEDREGLALFQGNDRLLPGRRIPPDPAPSPFPPAHLHGAHRGHVDPELALQRIADLG